MLHLYIRLPDLKSEAASEKVAFFNIRVSLQFRLQYQQLIEAFTAVDKTQLILRSKDEHELHVYR